ncbi:MAG: methylornithine synthase PylB [Selenomonadaceae bacterium]|nr:methylornithine synthase PylB [Selenomonadaceae bacterium]
MDSLMEVLKRAVEGRALHDEEIQGLLEVSSPEEREELFRAARARREKFFGQHVFLYGFVYFSTYCRNGCNFCLYRRGNSKSLRYRKSMDEILAAASALKESGVHLIDLTMGEDPFYLSEGAEGYEWLAGLVDAVKKETSLPVMVSPGVVEDSLLERLREAGADWYACYQETHTFPLYQELRPGQPYEKRWGAKAFAKNCGMLVEEGVMTGVGESTEDLLRSIHAMESLGADQVRAMTFVPQVGTPMFGASGKNQRELNLIAVMRLLLPDRIIPASLDVEGAEGLKARLEAGANAVTSLIPPQSGLAGVARCHEGIDNGSRTVKGILPILEECGLASATVEEYESWVEKRKRGGGAR